jgi:phosphoglycerol transferase MdoB-like AlkP superfamily enzyme
VKNQAAQLIFKHYFVATFLAVVIFMLMRVVMLLMLSPDQIFSAYGDDIGSAFWFGLRWDLKVMAIWFAPLLLILCVSLMLPQVVMHLLSRFSHVYFIIGILVSLWISAINYFYFNAFNSPFNAHAFAFFDDATTEVIKLLWHQYHLFANIIAAIVSVFLISWLFERANALIQHKLFSSVWHWLYLWPIAVLVIAFLARGSIYTFPLMKENSNVSDSRFVNDIVLNGPAQLEFAWQLSQANILSTQMPDVFKKYGFENKEAALSQLLHSYKNDENALGLPLNKTVEPKIGKAPNVVFVLMESFSSHIVESHSEKNNMLMGLEDWFPRGYYFDYSVSNRQGTNRSLESILLNSPISPLSKTSAAGHQFLSSNLLPLKQAGYQTSYLSGGSKAWMAHEDLWPYQGFDQFYGAAAVANEFDIKVANAWGVWDEYLFSSALKKLTQPSEQPQFMLLRTTTNHPPHMIPDDYQSSAIDISYFKDKALQNDEILLNQLQTFQYSSDQLALFLDELGREGILENTIVIMTGDHTMWNFYRYNERKDLLRSAAVPVWFLLPDSLKAELKISDVNIDQAASHQDIFPSLFEMILSGQSYQKLGRDLFEQKTDKELSGDNQSIAWHRSHFYLFENGIKPSGSNEIFELNGYQVTQKSELVTEKQAKAIKNQQALEALREWQIRQDAINYLSK